MALAQPDPAAPGHGLLPERIAPLRGSHRAVIALDMRRLGSILSLDPGSMTVTVGAGMRAPALERALSSNGLTLGHYPQSYEYVSLGGCAATRSAGQASTGYGAIEKMVLGLRLALSVPRGLALGVASFVDGVADGAGVTAIAALGDGALVSADAPIGAGRSRRTVRSRR